jgi:HD-GYP domain-containing protein (c-di-GMP phosphodiesterase class II)
MRSPPLRLRLIELLASLSLATDVVTGQQMGHGIRTSLLATDLARRLGCQPEQIRHVQQVALLRFLGCTAEVTTLARDVGGDDISFNRAMAPVLNGRRGESIRAVFGAVAPDQPAFRRVGSIVRVITDSSAERLTMESHCEVAAMLAGRLELDDTVTHCLRHAYERWDGRGFPDGLKGEEVPLAIRVCALARDVDIISTLGGDPVQVVESRSGKTYDPAVAAVFAHGDIQVPEAVWDDLLAAEPPPVAIVDRVDDALAVMADMADLKSQWTRGHSRRVAALAGEAALAADMPGDDVEAIQRAALVHDLGRVGVENGIWDKPGPLSIDEWEKVRLHTYLTDRILSRCEYLKGLARTAARHHERPDGMGYHQRLERPNLSLGDQILAASSAYVAMTSERPHRPALLPEDAASKLEKSATEEAFDIEAVRHVLHALGHETNLRASSVPGGLTDREVEVLRLLTREHTNREIADELFISPKTVGRHVENIYTKIGVSTRAGAAVFAMENGLHR